MRLKMMSPTLMILISITTMAILSGESFGAMPAQCNSEFLEELPPRLRKICVAIARIWDAREMNDFVDDREYRENLPRYDSSVKRQDVDHVFLRFGKRR
ncbi:myosuppressin isoform X1 [Camponotus floridanus]|nr:myosuppressin isoform X1 [Camponotus floridanus]